MIQILIASFLAISIFFTFIVYCALANKKPTPFPNQKCDTIPAYQPGRQWQVMRYEKNDNVPAVINGMTNRAPATQ
jgi:hypothetical protein